jgi:hypothetical protein
MDPRVKAINADLQKQFDLSKQLYDNWLQFQSISRKLQSLTANLAKAKEQAGQNAAVSAQIEAFGKKLQAISAGNSPGSISISTVLSRIRTLFDNLQEVDAAPTTQLTNAVGDVLRDSQSALENWRKFETEDLNVLNRQLNLDGNFRDKN